MRNKFVITIVSLLIGAIIAIFITNNTHTSSTTQVILIPPGTSLTKIAETLEENHLIKLPKIFMLYAVITGYSKKLQVGEYKIDHNSSWHNILNQIATGQRLEHWITIPEGITVQQAINLINNEPVLEGDITYKVQEGHILPDTYKIFYYDSRNELLKHMKEAMDKELAKQWDARDLGVPFTTPEQAVILASIVEKETKHADEKQRVAAIFINRLEKNMLLQADPTIIYGITNGKYILDRPLSKKDLLDKNNLYNSYIYKGLPPTAIACPGKETLYATLHPAKTDDLYFVLSADGKHSFATNLKTHNDNVKKYRSLK